MNANKLKEISDFCKSYKQFITKAKTERLAVKEIEKIAVSHGYKKFESMDHLTIGSKIYFINKNKNIILYKMGRSFFDKGLNILASHIDSPRLDLKQNPLYETNEFCMLDTHYYGSIKKYHYLATPLSIMGIIYKKEGSYIEVNLGEDIGDPIFGITDIIPHLAENQMSKIAEKMIDGENLDIVFGSIPLNNSNEQAVKTKILKMLKEKYEVEEEDFSSAEIEIVPSNSARDFGLDRSMIAAYGQDDRSCAYASLIALMHLDDSDKSMCAMFFDKEEIGNVGATSAESLFFENTLMQMMEKIEKIDILSFRKLLQKSTMLVCDVAVALDPLYGNLCDTKNVSKFNYGVSFSKYLGVRGKLFANDANPAFFAQIRKILDENNIFFQSSEFGNVDQGGASTISYLASKYNMEVIDTGIPVLNMHSPMEIISKADLYEMYLAYKVLLINL